MTKHVALILMSTFNGEKFLAEQIESIRAQSFDHWRLLIRDDGSSDQTKKIITRYCKMDERIIHHQDHLGNLNIPQSFSQLMQKALDRHEQYIFFADQDDVWLPDKLAKSLFLLQQKEYEAPHQAILIHSDLKIVDSQLRTIHPSFLQFEHLKRNTQDPLKTLLINNFVTGCTVAMNRNLLKLVTPIPNNVFMHDWWCALCAAALGNIHFVAEQTILYRQHEQNTVGSKHFANKCLELLSFKKNLQKRKKNLANCFFQAQELLLRIQALSTHHEEDLTMKSGSRPQEARPLRRLEENPNYFHHLLLLEQFSSLPTLSLPARLRQANKLRLHAASPLRKIMFWCLLLV